MGYVNSWRESWLKRNTQSAKASGKKVSITFKEQGEQCCWSKQYGGKIKRDGSKRQYLDFHLLKIFICYFALCLSLCGDFS